MTKICVNGVDVWAKNNSSVIQACQAIGAIIPRFCYHDKLFVAGNCRMCLVEIGNSLKPQASCALPLFPSLKVFTKSALVNKAQEGIMELILLHHPLDCPVCDQGGECELQEQSFNFGGDSSRLFFPKNSLIDLFWGSLIKTILRRCILCTRCVRYANLINGDDFVRTSNRGERSEISTYKKKIYKSEASGGVIDLCPVCWNNFSSLNKICLF